MYYISHFFILVVVLSSLTLIVIVCCRGTTRGRNCILKCLSKYFGSCLCYRKNSPPSTVISGCNIQNVHDIVEMEEVEI
jgi:hypothetical protein